MFASVAGGPARAHWDARGCWGMVMSWKELFLILLIVGTVVLALVEHNFFRGVLFIAERVIAVILAFGPGFLHFVAALVR